jgi:hypothetical protein
MHTVDLLNRAIRYAEEIGIHVREEWLDGAGGGECEMGEARWLFLDLSQSPQERLLTISSFLAELDLEDGVPTPDELEPFVKRRPAA